MNYIEEQRHLIDKLYQLIQSSVSEKYDSATCWFDYQRSEDGSASIDSQLSYEINGNTHYGRLRYPDRQLLDCAMPQLHEKMKVHTGGDWQTFTLTINKGGSVTTKFEYPERQA